ncbi:MAG: hypothetical protein ABI369_08720 [Acetobacteraceae bacterium]
MAPPTWNANGHAQTTAQPYALISQPTAISTIFGLRQAIALLLLLHRPPESPAEARHHSPA